MNCNTSVTQQNLTQTTLPRCNLTELVNIIMHYVVNLHIFSIWTKTLVNMLARQSVGSGKVSVIQCTCYDICS